MLSMWLILNKISLFPGLSSLVLWKNSTIHSHSITKCKVENWLKIFEIDLKIDWKFLSPASIGYYGFNFTICCYTTIFKRLLCHRPTPLLCQILNSHFLLFLSHCSYFQELNCMGFSHSLYNFSTCYASTKSTTVLWVNINTQNLFMNVRRITR